MKRTLLSLGLVAGAALAGPAAAAYYDRGVEYDYARVLSVDPIYDEYAAPAHREVCYDQPVYRRASGSATPAIVGAIVGGVVGNQFGSGSGRDAATVAGALLGGSIARDSQRRDGYRDGYYDRRPAYAQRCEVRTDYERRAEIVGYDVEYEYNGRIGHTRTETHPGRRIRVAVDVVPIGR